MTSYKLPIHLIRQYLFCPRVVYFLEVLNIPRASPVWVREGGAHHKKQTELFKRRTLARFGLQDATLSGNVSLSHQRFDFYGVCDALIAGVDSVYSVEIKLHGDKPTKSQKMQLIAYGMLAEAIHDKKFDMGFVLYEKNGKTVPVKVTDKDKTEVVEIVGEIIQMIKTGRLPYSSADDGKCTQCEFLNYCNDRF
ncbi:MAG TPA: CRISPR-associated protein Cas4 [Campylobacterales bacterium]|nr:CRISPR-associated protein Cas4 [Campylobacterales bacterium]